MRPWSIVDRDRSTGTRLLSGRLAQCSAAANALSYIKADLLSSCVAGVVLMLALDTGAQVITQIASAGNVSFYVRSDGSLWRGDFAHAQAKSSERMRRLMDDLKRQSGSSQAFAAMHEEAKHMISGNFEPVDLIVSNGVTAVAMNGQGNTFFIKADGSLWAMGGNDAACRGDGTYDTPDHPIQIVPRGVVAVVCGEMFTLFLKEDGSVWGFGWNLHGPLGDGTEGNSVERPKQLISGGVAAIAAGHAHSLFIKRDGSLWGAGSNQVGQLGLGTNVDQVLRPVEILNSGVASVAAARSHTLFIKRDGSLWAMGMNDWGQIGDGTIEWRYRPVQVISNEVVAVAAGYSGSLFLKTDGSLWAMGINWGSDYGEGIEFQSRYPTLIFAGNQPAPVAGYYYNAKLKTCASIFAGKFNGNSTVARPSATVARPTLSAADFPGYNLITIEELKDGDVQLSYSGSAGLKYALERSSDLVYPKWVPLVTNMAPAGGVLVMTNTPDRSMNNFWRIRSVP